MIFLRVLSVVLVPVWFLIVSAAEDVSESVVTTAPSPVTTRPSSGENSTKSDQNRRGMVDVLKVDSSMMQRALYVLIGISIFGVLFFVIRAVRLKRPVQRKKYGLLSNYEESVEMEAVESDEDDTLYEARSLRR